MDRVEGDPGMQHLTLLATSEGHWVLPGTPEFLAALGDPDPDYDSLSFAVKNLGFVKFEVLDRSTVQIELHPRNVEFPALLAAQQQISSCGFKLFRIRYFETDWKFEIYPLAQREPVAKCASVSIPSPTISVSAGWASRTAAPRIGPNAARSRRRQIPASS